LSESKIDKYSSIKDDPVKLQIDLDLFAGVKFGDSPFYNYDVYRSTVQNLHISGSTNLTLTIRSEILNLVKFDVEVTLVPLLVGAGFSFYATSALADNCAWFHADVNILEV